MADDVAMTGEETRRIAVADSEVPGSPQTREDGPDVSKPVPVPDGESGTLQVPPKANGAAGEARPVKRKGGRPRGLGKVLGSGRRKGSPNALGRDARQWLAENSNYLDVIARTCAGKAIRMAGPTGKQMWRYPDWADRRWAIELVARKLIPDVTASEISGPDGAPLIEPTHHDELFSKVEVARRVAFVLAGGLEAKREMDKMDAPGVDTEVQFIPEPEPEAETATEAPEPPVEPTEPPLSKHAYRGRRT